MRSNYRAGFGATEGLVIVAVIVVIGALGYVYVRNLNSQMANTNQSKVATPATATEAKAEASQVKKELESINIDSELNTSEIDATLQ